MTRRLILHIGPMKTGSTAIQRWLGHSHASLSAAGFFLPRALTSNASRLAVISLSRRDGKALTEFDEKRLADFQAEIGNMPAATPCAIVSGEMLGQKLRTADAVASLRDLLAPYFSDIRVVAYLRRQDQLSLSHYSTALRLGERRARPLHKVFDFDEMLSAWAEVFGRDAMTVRIFDRKRLVNGDVVEDFASVLGLPFTKTDAKARDENPSLLPNAQAFLARLAASVRDAGYDRPFMGIRDHDLIVQLLNKQYAGKGFMPARADAMKFCSQAEDSNERVRRAWFPDQERLFSDDFSAYPEEEVRRMPPVQILEVAMAVLTAIEMQPKEFLDPGKVPLDAVRGDPVMQVRLEKRAMRRKGQGGHAKAHPPAE